ncbi:MAG: hypothetical protein KBS76_05735 [Ruminococcus sp.]|nr:hypothetical protein [Candidatus Apopatosoma intestinale]
MRLIKTVRAGIMMIREDFWEPNDCFRPRPLLFLSGKPTKDGVRRLLRGCKEIGYGGVGVISYKDTEIEYLSEEYFAMYAWILEEARALGLKVCLYDEFWFPSGKAGGLLAERFPEAVTKRLTMIKDELPLHGEPEIPDGGVLMSAVAYDGETGARIDVTEEFQRTGTVKMPGKGGWQLLRFYCVRGLRGMVNYLDPEAVKCFIGLTHEAFYERFADYFGTTIDSAFYDEPQFYSQHGKTWTVRFNEEFIKRKGYSPALLYPSLFMDTGGDDAWARSELLSVRADLYAEGFPGTIQAWCRDHGISLKGHIDQEEVVNPSGITDDAIKSFRYQDIPGIDQIFEPGRASRAYKIIASAADNWDKSLVMCECFGAMEGLTEEQMYAEAQDMFAKGINEIIPHAVWYDDKNVKFEPELSWRHPYYGKILPDFNAFVSRVSSVLQRGRHVSHVGVLYPIEGLHAQYTFLEDDDLDISAYYAGGKFKKENDYQDVGEYLFYTANHDFTYLHPDRLTYDTEIKDGYLVLTNSRHDNAYSVIILTGQDTVSPKTLEVLSEFVRCGGTVIATSLLPKHASEKGRDADVEKLVYDLFGVSEMPDFPMKKAHGKGSAWAIPFGALSELGNILSTLPFDLEPDKQTDGIGYVHRAFPAGEAYYLVNRNENAVRLNLTLRETRGGDLTLMDPYTGAVSKIDAVCEDGCQSFSLTVPANRSCFVVSGEIAEKPA